MEDKSRERLDGVIATARRMLIDERGWTVDHPDLLSPAFQIDLREKTKEVLFDDELARRKKRTILMAEEGRQKQEEENEINERKRKKDEEKRWENTREDRIQDWRKFQSKGTDDTPKKKSKKLRVLG